MQLKAPPLFQKYCTRFAFEWAPLFIFHVWYAVLFDLVLHLTYLIQWEARLDNVKPTPSSAISLNPFFRDQQPLALRSWCLQIEDICEVRAIWSVAIFNGNYEIHEMTESELFFSLLRNHVLLQDMQNRKAAYSAFESLHI